MTIMDDPETPTPLSPEAEAYLQQAISEIRNRYSDVLKEVIALSAPTISVGETTEELRSTLEGVTLTLAEAREQTFEIVEALRTKGDPETLTSWLLFAGRLHQAILGIASLLVPLAPVGQGPVRADRDPEVKAPK